MGCAPVNDHNVDTHAHLPVRPVPGGQTHALLLSRQTHTRREKDLGRETVIICNQAQKTRKGNLSSETEIEIDRNK